jgi:hypothetical protein
MRSRPARPKRNARIPCVGEALKMLHEAKAATPNEREKLHATLAIKTGSDDMIFWFVGRKGAFHFMANSLHSDCMVADLPYNETFVYSQADDLKMLAQRFSDGQHAVKGSVAELEAILREVREEEQSREVSVTTSSAQTPEMEMPAPVPGTQKKAIGYNTSKYSAPWWRTTKLVKTDLFHCDEYGGGRIAIPGNLYYLINVLAEEVGARSLGENTPEDQELIAAIKALIVRYVEKVPNRMMTLSVPDVRRKRSEGQKGKSGV